MLGLAFIYLPGLANELVFDDSYLTEGLFRDYADPTNVRVRMVSYGSFVWVHALLGEGWWKQRLVNLALHVGVVVCLWGFWREMLRHIAAPADAKPGEEAYWRSPALGLAIAVFALNPVAVYGVGYLIQRSIVMATLFSVAALWCLARGLRVRSIPLMLAALPLYALAVGSKEHALLLPLAGLAVFVLIARPDARRLWMIAGLMAALVCGIAAALHLRYGDILFKPFDEYSQLYLKQLSALDPDAPRKAYGLSVMNQSWLFLRYGAEWLLPYSGWMSINMRPPFPVHWLTLPHVLGIAGYLAVCGAGGFLLLKYRDARALLGLSLLMPALLFGTEFATVWVQDPFSLYRSYLWAIAIPGIAFCAFHGTPLRILATLGVVVGGLLVWQAFDRVQSMANNETVWSDAIEKLPNDPRSVGRWVPYLNRGSSYAERGDFRKALEDFRMSSRLNDQGMGLFNMGSVLSAHGRHREALVLFDRAEKEGYNLYNLPFQRGLAQLGLGQFQEAYREMDATLRARPPSPFREFALLNFAKAGLQIGHTEESLGALKEVLAAEPANREARYLFGMAHVMKGDASGARDVFDGLVREGAATASVHYGRAIANYRLGRKSEARDDVEAAMRLGLDDAKIRAWKAEIDRER